jgi:Fe-S cluster assembly scaffold protein SufB
LVESNTRLDAYIYSLNDGYNKHIKVEIHHESSCVSNFTIKALVSSHSQTQIDLVSIASRNTKSIEANQTVDGILFGDLANINVTPSMSIDTNIIKSSHSVNIGNINPEHLFYLMSRGIDKKSATTIILDGMFDEIKRAHDKKAQDLYNNIVLTLGKMVKK